jgi:ABC-type multidrug transport system fused ATPase/permease subunit
VSADASPQAPPGVTAPAEPDDDQAVLPVATRAEVRGYVSGALRRHHRAFLAVILLQGVATGAGLVGPAVLGRLVDAYARRAARPDLAPALAAFAASVAVDALFMALSRARSARLGETLLAEIREAFMAAAVALPLGTVELAGSGELVSRATTDVDRLADSARRGAPAVLTAAVAVTITIGALAVSAPVLALPALLPLLLVIPSTRWYRRRSPGAFQAVMTSWARVAGRLAESADAARTVEALRVGQDRLDRVDADLAGWLRTERRALRLEAVWFPAVDGTYALVVAATVLCGGLMHGAGWVTLGQATAATLYVRRLVEPVDELIGWLDELQRGSTALGRVLGVLSVGAGAGTVAIPPQAPPPGAAWRARAAPRATAPPPPAPRDRADAVLRATDIRFGYRPGQEVLHGVDLAVAPGERLAVVGPSGAGKSSLGRLLAGVHPPWSGRITYGGNDLTRLPVEELRARVVLVTQEHHIFTGTLADNLRLGRPGASPAELAAALEVVGAGEWATTLPAGLEEIVGPGGEPVTGGRAQQVALARLILADPRVIVLDEATAALDPTSARRTERALAAVLAGRTVVAIAHRLFTARDADRIAVVEGGRIAELGSHDELMASGGAYAALWASWRSAC